MTSLSYRVEGIESQKIPGLYPWCRDSIYIGNFSYTTSSKWKVTIDKKRKNGFNTGALFADGVNYSILSGKFNQMSPANRAALEPLILVHGLGYPDYVIFFGQIPLLFIIKNKILIPKP